MKKVWRTGADWSPRSTLGVTVVSTFIAPEAYSEILQVVEQVLGKFELTPDHYTFSK